ncbi:MAG TPA: CHAD domain-containing protein [Xanthomonadaceae bacterium]|nr:CHAD domain-containing protein [Xanthomonadaceae bacterium]
MAYRFGSRESVQSAVRRVAREQIDRAVARIDSGDRHRAVHLVRRHGKRLRALLRLVEPVFPEAADEYAQLRAIARPLSAVRDARVAVATAGRLRERCDALDRSALLPALQAALQAYCEALARGVDGAPGIDALMASARAQLLAQRERVTGWSLSADGFEAVGEGFARSYRRARRAMRAALDGGDAGQWHRWRRRGKVHACQLELLRPLWPALLEARAGELRRLNARLGEHHDLAQLPLWFAALPGAAAPAELDPCARARTQALERDCRPLGMRLYADRPRDLVRDLRRWWNLWGQSAPHDA